MLSACPSLHSHSSQNTVSVISGPKQRRLAGGGSSLRGVRWPTANPHELNWAKVSG